uniref:Uncharacterized protein n=1 Tax=Arundo donax TaxID=35708 RepID=A0A0A9CZP0_ARUDO
MQLQLQSTGNSYADQYPCTKWCKIKCKERERGRTSFTATRLPFLVLIR